MTNKNGYAICFNEWLFDKDIKSELNLLLLISSLCAEKGYCWATNEYFSELFKIDTVSISRKIKKLEDLGHVKIVYEKRGCEIVKREIRLTKMLTEDIQKNQSTINKNVKDNNTINNNTIINNSLVLNEEIKIIDYSISEKSTTEEKIIKQFHVIFCEARTTPGKPFKNKTLESQKMESWKKDLDKLMRIDERGIDDLREVYNFLKKSNDLFWINTISSIQGLRKNWDKIVDKMNYEKKTKKVVPEENQNVLKGSISNIMNKK